jgi:hypothetical protein
MPKPGLESGLEEQQTLNGIPSWQNPGEISSSSCNSVQQARRSVGSNPDLEDEVITALRSLSRDVTFLRDEVGNLNNRIDRASGGKETAIHPEPPAQGRNPRPAPVPEPAARQGAWDAKENRTGAAAVLPPGAMMESE